MEERKRKINIGDLLFKLVLIAIIILLLIHNCSTIKKLNGNEDNSKTPTGNIDVFEIQCEKETCQDVLGDKTETQKPTTPDKPENNNKPNTTPSKPDNSNNNNAGNNDSPDYDADLIVKDTVEWKSQNELRIFSNPAYQMETKIAPESSNTYQFIVRNNTKYNVKYNIDFSEENDSNINMRYRLKKGNNYVIGNDTTWVRYNDLDLSAILINSSEDHTYYLEWKWFSSDNDTSIGANLTSKYKLNIVISAESQYE